MRVALVMPVVALACGSSPPPAPTVPIASEVVRAPPTTPAPTIGFADNAFKPTRLPAIAHAGEIVVVAVSDTDGGRGHANLRVEVRDRYDKLLETHTVMTAHEYEQLVADGKPTPALDQRLAKIDETLARLHALHDLVAMKGLEALTPSGDDLRHMCTGDGLDVEFRDGRLHVFPRSSQRPIVDRDATAWAVPSHKPCPQCDECTNPPFLAAAYHARGINTLVIEIGYRGTDTCWEPGDAFHVVTW
jgi:hypothetical protein